MRFSEWQKKLDQQQARVGAIALSDVSETLCIDGDTITITIGKGKYIDDVNGSSRGLRYLRPLYTNHKEEFDAFLEEITEATDKVVAATEAVLTEIGSAAIPGAMIQRMKGEQTSGEPDDLVKSMAKEKLTELKGILDNLLREFESSIVDFEYRTDIAGRELNLQWRNRVNYWVRWGLRIGCKWTGVEINDAEEAMYFLANYEIIKKRLLGVFQQIKTIK